MILNEDWYRRGDGSVLSAPSCTSTVGYSSSCPFKKSEVQSPPREPMWIEACGRMDLKLIDSIENNFNRTSLK
jgi:hypothetical protein